MVRITDQLEINYVAQYLHQWHNIKPESILSVELEQIEDDYGFVEMFYYVEYDPPFPVNPHEDYWHETRAIRVLVNEVDCWYNEKEGENDTA